VKAHPEPTRGFHQNPYHHRPSVENLKNVIEDSASNSWGHLALYVLLEAEKTKFGKRIPNMIAMAAITIVVFLPSAIYLATITAAAQVAPNYCNNAGGCPWTS